MIAVQGAYFVPAIYDGGVSRDYGPVLLSAAPVVMIIVQNYLGTASDRCTCAWGRRRPFILAPTIVCVLGLLIFPFTSDLFALISDDASSSWVFVVLVITTAILVDCSVTCVQIPLRAYLLDVLPEKQLVLGNIIYPMFAMLGATASFGLGAVNWSSIFTPSDNPSTQVKFVSGIAIVITVALTLITLCSVKEQRLKQVNDGHIVNPLPSNTDDDKFVSGCSKNYFSYDDITILPYGNYIGDDSQIGIGCGDNSQNCLKKMLYNFVIGNAQFIFHISSSMVILCIACFLIVVI